MGIEYKIVAADFEKAAFEPVLKKSLSAYTGFVKSVSPIYLELRATNHDQMPDAAIQIEEDGVLFTYNGGHMEIWAIFGLLVSSMAAWFNEIKVTEL